MSNTDFADYIKAINEHYKTLAQSQAKQDGMATVQGYVSKPDVGDFMYRSDSVKKVNREGQNRGHY